MNKLKINIAIVEDSKPYSKLLSLAVSNSIDSEGISTKIDCFSTPVDYKISGKKYDVVILDYFFRNYTYGSNGFYLAKFTKEKHPNTFVVINSSYKKSEVSSILEEFKEYIDEYSYKEDEMSVQGGILHVLKKYVKRRLENG